MKPLRHLTTVLLIAISSWLYAEPRELDWLELMPEADRIALENMPDIDHGVSPERPGDFSAPGGMKQAPGLPAVMYSANTVAALDKQQIRLAGYPVPLDSDGQGLSREFFLVPYAGACIHVPPPPPNQIILVSFAEGLLIEDLYIPIEVSGELRIESVSDPLADAAYVMQASSVQLLTEEQP